MFFLEIYQGCLFLQEAISHLQLLEEELVESHRSTIVGMQQWTKDDLSLLNMTNEVDYDQDGNYLMKFIYILSLSQIIVTQVYIRCRKYFSFFTAYCQQLEDMIAEKIDTFSTLRDKARNFRKCLNDEEAKSRQLMNRNF